MTKTNFTMVKELMGKYKPAARRFVSTEEVALIKETLQLEDATELELRNMRDFVVAALGRDSDEEWDKMSAITHVIDRVLFERGCAV